MSPGIKIVCYPKSSYGSFVVYANFPEYEEMTFIQQVIKNGDTVIDVGANIGAISVLAAGSGANTKVYAFEPTPNLVPLIAENISINQFQDRITIHDMAISNQEGSIDFVLTGESEVNHIATTQLLPGQTVKKVSTITLDTFAQKNNINQIDFLKVDVEGAELLVFQGAKKLLETGKIKIIVFELNKNYAEFGYTPNELVNYLKNHNYFVFRLTHNGTLKLIEKNLYIMKTINLIAINKDTSSIRRVEKFLV